MSEKVKPTVNSHSKVQKALDPSERKIFVAAAVVSSFSMPRLAKIAFPNSEVLQMIVMGGGIYFFMLGSLFIFRKIRASWVKSPRK